MLSSPGANLSDVAALEKVASIAVPMERQIAPVQDLVSLWRLWRTVRRLRPTIVDASTPKAGLLRRMAALLARVPCRVYTMRGLRLETAAGFKRALLWATEWIACRCSHRVVCVSPSLRARAIGFNLVAPEKAMVLAKGSGGVDADDSPRSTRAPRRRKPPLQLGIPTGAPVLGYVGRLVKDKGIRAASGVVSTTACGLPFDCALLLVGDFEQGDAVEPEVRRYIESEDGDYSSGFCKRYRAVLRIDGCAGTAHLSRRLSGRPARSAG